MSLCVLGVGLLALVCSVGGGSRSALLVCSAREECSPSLLLPIPTASVDAVRLAPKDERERERERERKEGLRERKSLILFKSEFDFCR